MQLWRGRMTFTLRQVNNPKEEIRSGSFFPSSLLPNHSAIRALKYNVIELDTIWFYSPVRIQANTSFVCNHEKLFPIFPMKPQSYMQNNILFKELIIKDVTIVTLPLHQCLKNVFRKRVQDSDTKFLFLSDKLHKNTLLHKA